MSFDNTTPPLSEMMKHAQICCCKGRRGGWTQIKTLALENVYERALLATRLAKLLKPQLAYGNTDEVVEALRAAASLGIKVE